MDIQTLYNEWKALQPLSAENQKRLDDKFMLEFNYNSNHIEGNTLTYGQTISLLVYGKAEGNAPMRDYEEMKAHHAALEYIKQKAKEKERPLTEVFIRDVHQIMMKEDYTIYDQRDGKPIQYTIHVGKYKTRPNSVKTLTGEIFEYASPEETPALMADLVAWYNETKAEGKLSPLQLAALFHFRYIRIHPFEDGNGRIARLMVNFILSSYGYPMIVIHTEDKNNYISALEKCDYTVGSTPSDGAHATLEQITPLVEYLEKCVERALQISIKAAKGENIEEEDDLQKKLAILARNAQGKKGNIKRIDRNQILDIYDNFIIPFSEKIKESLSIFGQFYGDSKVTFCKYKASAKRYYKEFRLSFEGNNINEIKDREYIIRIELESPSVLIPTDSKETIDIRIKFDDEKYELQILDNDITFNYGVLPNDSERKKWIKNITKHIYTSIEQKVSETN